MRSAIRLKRRHFTESYYGVLTPSWVSNAHWAVRRTKVLNAAMFTSKDAVGTWLHDCLLKDKADADIEKFWAAPLKPFRVTPIMVGVFTRFRVLLAADDYAVFNDEILRMFRIETDDVLYASDGEKQFCELPTYEMSDFTLMPMRRFSEAPLLESVREWASVLKLRTSLGAAKEHAVTTAASAAK